MLENNPFNSLRIVPIYSEITSRNNINISQKLTKFDSGIELIICNSPLIPANMDTISGINMLNYCNNNNYISFLHRYSTRKEMEHLISIIDLPKSVGISIGVNNIDIKNFDLFYNCKQYLPIVCVDIAHGHSKLMKETLQYIKESPNYRNIIVVAGNVCTREGLEDLLEWGADYVKIGIGPGSVCKTTEYTGVGLPQTSVINELLLLVDDRSTDRIIFDGGFKCFGDMCKALTISSLVMSGSVFAGTDRCPNWTSPENRTGIDTTSYRGMASYEAKKNNDKDLCFIEGKSEIVSLKEKDSTNKVYESFSDALKSAMSYSNSNTLEEFKAKAQLRFI